MTRKNKKPKEKYSYAFPDVLAKAMSKVDFRAQVEASMLSQFLLIIGLTFMVLFMIFTKSTTGLYKFIVIFNLICGWVLISSYLVTTYQQYVSYMSAMGFDPTAEKAAVKKKGHIFKRIKIAIRNKRAKKMKAKIKVPDELEIDDKVFHPKMEDTPINTEIKGGINKNG